MSPADIALGESHCSVGGRASVHGGVSHPSGPGGPWRHLGADRMSLARIAVSGPM